MYITLGSRAIWLGVPSISHSRVPRWGVGGLIWARHAGLWLRSPLANHCSQVIPKPIYLKHSSWLQFSLCWLSWTNSLPLGFLFCFVFWFWGFFSPCFHVCSPRPLLGRLGSAAADLHPLWGVDCRPLCINCCKDKDRGPTMCPAYAWYLLWWTHPLCSLLLVHPKASMWPFFHLPCGLSNSDIFSKTLHRKLPGRKFPSHIRISWPFPNWLGAFSPSGCHVLWHLFSPLLTVVSSVCGWQPPLGTEPRKSSHEVQGPVFRVQVCTWLVCSKPNANNFENMYLITTN